MCIESRFCAKRILAAWLILSLIVGQTGCVWLGARARAELKSGKVEQGKGLLLRQDERVIEESVPTSLSVRLEKLAILGSSVRVTAQGKKKQRVETERVHEKTAVYDIYKAWFDVDKSKRPRDPILHEIFAGGGRDECDYGLCPEYELVPDIICSICSAGIVGLYAFLSEDPIFSHREEKVVGEIKEKEKLSRHVMHPIPNLPVLLDCGPAGQHRLVTDKDGQAVLHLEPLLNRLARDYSWTIKATAKWEGFTAEDNLTLSTTELGVTWDKPRYQPDLPPKLTATAEFRDANRNQMLDAREEAALITTLKNNGRGDAFQIISKAQITGEVEGVELSPSEVNLESLAKGQEKPVEFSLKAEEEVPAQRFRVRISFEELNGFEPPPILVNLATRPYSPPKLTLARWSLDDDNAGMSTGNGNRRLEHGEQAEITMLVQNVGSGAAENVSVALKVSEPNLFAKALSSDLGEIPPGEWRKAVFTLRVNNRYDGPEQLPIEVSICERRPKFALSRSLDIPLGKDLSQEEEVVLVGTERPAPLPELRPLPKIDRKVPILFDDLTQGTRYAMLIGINNYLDGEVQSLHYAENDIHDLYAVLTDPQFGGYDKSNVFFMTPDAGQPQDRPTKTNILLTLKWMSENLELKDSLLFAFCGHGETEEDVNYLMPLDGRLSLPQDTSIRLGRLFEWLDACPAKRQVVMLDACHSGGPSKYLRGQRGIRVASKAFANELDRIGTPEGRAVLASCSREEVSYEDPKLSHGVFTYYTLEGLKKLKADKNNDGNVTVYELGNFLQVQVKSWSKKNRKSPSQTPRVVYNDTSGDIVLVNKK